MYPLEPILSAIRLLVAQPFIQKDAIVCDVGCGESARLLNYVKTKIKQGIGLDELVTPHKEGNLVFKTVDVNKEKLPLKNESVTVVTLLAVIEHVKYPDKLVKEAYRILKKDGVLIMTTPSPQNEALLNLLSKLKLVDPYMIDQHQTYFDLKLLSELATKNKFMVKKTQTFELGLNLLLVAQK